MRRTLKDPRFWLAFFALLALAAAADSLRAPPRQLTARAYCLLVRQYQRFGRPLLRGRITCRYVPTCSEYSLQAVQAFGIRRGLVLTVSRLARCRDHVPPGTPDPLPSLLPSP